MNEAMKEMNRMIMAEAAAAVIQTAIITAQSVQQTWVNVAVAGTYCQTSINGMDESYIIILIRYNRETLIYPDLDIILPSNNISDEIVETINKILQSNKTIAI